ncbi:hypothetical protein AK812_SmicGene15553 [Symbiodinium microadriaticum]|uniref:Uncharacterized protein n=1 Tax=Symbiodinium microadriaticum TaxID=2951 RepID=A0A1Q9E2N0_SYMMI|nr:hypothetical protein AK812_SmicGene15553 [Symbiodinium microadriaticum]
MDGTCLISAIELQPLARHPNRAMALHAFICFMSVAEVLASPKEGFDPGLGACSLTTAPHQRRVTALAMSPTSHDPPGPAFSGPETMLGGTHESMNSNFHDTDEDLNDYARNMVGGEDRDSELPLEARRVQNLQNTSDGATMPEHTQASHTPAMVVCSSTPGWITSAMAQLQRLRLQQQGWEPLWLAVLRRIVHRGDPAYEEWSRSYLRQLQSEFSRHRQYHLYTEALTTQEQAWACQVEMANFQDYLEAGHASPAATQGPLETLETDSHILAGYANEPDPNLPYGIFHATWVNSATGQWGPPGTHDPRTDGSVQDDADLEQDDMALFQTGSTPRPNWEQLMEQLGDWFHEGRQVGMAISMVRALIHARDNNRYRRWCTGPMRTLGAGYPGSDGTETQQTPPDFFEWANSVEAHLYAAYENEREPVMARRDGRDDNGRERGAEATDMEEGGLRPTVPGIGPREYVTVVLEEATVTSTMYALFDRSRFGLDLSDGSRIAEHYLPNRVIEEIRSLHEQMSQQNRLISSVALVTVLRYIMCDIAQVVQAADTAARDSQGDDSGAAPEPDEELLMQTYLATQGKDTSDRRWARAMVRLQKELSGMHKSARLACIRRLQLGTPSHVEGQVSTWTAQFEALLVVMAADVVEVEGPTEAPSGWLEQWHAELVQFIPEMQLVEGALEVESQVEPPAGQPEQGELTDRDIEQLAADQEEERERRRVEAEQEGQRQEEYDAMCAAELRHLEGEAREYQRWETEQMREALGRKMLPPAKRRCVIRLEAASGSSDRPRVLHTLSLDVPEQGELHLSFRASMQPDPEDVPTEPGSWKDDSGPAPQMPQDACPVHSGEKPTTLQGLEFEEYQALYAKWESGDMGLDHIKAQFGGEVAELIQAQRAVAEAADESLLRDQTGTTATALDQSSNHASSQGPHGCGSADAGLRLSTRAASAPGAVGTPRLCFGAFEQVYGGWKAGDRADEQVEEQFGPDWLRLFRLWRRWGLGGIWPHLHDILDMRADLGTGVVAPLIENRNMLGDHIKIPFVVVRAYYEQWKQGLLDDVRLAEEYGGHWVALFHKWSEVLDVASLLARSWAALEGLRREVEKLAEVPSDSMEQEDLERNGSRCTMLSDVNGSVLSSCLLWSGSFPIGWM